MSTYTTTQLATAVLSEMGVIAAGETPASADSTYVTDAYAAKFQEWTAPGMELTYWVQDTIPGAIFLILRDLMILEVTGAFGQPITPEEREGREIVILKRLRRHVRVEFSKLPTVAEYF